MGKCRDCVYSDRPTYKWPCSSCWETKDGLSMFCPKIDKDINVPIKMGYIQRSDAQDLIQQIIMADMEPQDAYAKCNAIPAADVRPVVRGKWIVDQIASNIFQCSICGQDAPVEPTGGTEYKSNFCPNCGADMRED